MKNNKEKEKDGQAKSWIAIDFFKNRWDAWDSWC